MGGKSLLLYLGIWPYWVLEMWVNLSQISIPCAEEGSLNASSNGSLALKANTAAETGAGAKLFIEIPWCGLSIRSQQSLESLSCAGLIPVKPPSLWSPLPLRPWGPVRCWTLSWEVKLWKPDKLWFVTWAFWRCHVSAHGCAVQASCLPATPGAQKAYTERGRKTRKPVCCNLLLKNKIK